MLTQWFRILSYSVNCFNNLLPIPFFKNNISNRYIRKERKVDLIKYNSRQKKLQKGKSQSNKSKRKVTIKFSVFVYNVLKCLRWTVKDK
jgi:hypothetical protein